MAKIISFINHKGGVGKTTTTINVGASLALKGYKVLVIDLDPQMNLTQSFGMENVGEQSIYEALTDLADKGINNIPIYNIKNNLDIVISSLDLSVAEVELMNEPGKEFLLKELIKPIKKKYDYILIDCMPALGLLTINALTASSHVIIPIQAEFLALKGMLKLIFVIEKVKSRLNKPLNFSGVVLTQFQSNVNLHKTVEEQVTSHFDNVFDTRISKNISLAEAQSHLQDVFSFSPKSSGAEDYNNLTEEIITKLK